MSITQGLLHSMAVRRQRLLLDAIGERVGTRVAYLKAAWADPVLYGGRGERTGVDVDVLVDPAAFKAFARELEREGFVRVAYPTHPVSAYAGKDWSFEAPAGYTAVDLHRALAVPPWFDLDGPTVLRRAIPYASLDGEIVSLCPEDQVVFLAAHLGTHVLDLDGRHLEDVVRLARRFPIDWDLVARRARRAHLSAATALCAQALALRGVSVPEHLTRPADLGSLRRAWLMRHVDLSVLARRHPHGAVVDCFVLLPAVSDRTSALPRFLMRQAALRALDWAAGLAGLSG